MKKFDLNKYMCENRKHNGYVKQIQCRDGFTISVQASSGHYCSPRESKRTIYDSVECGFPSAKPQFIMEYAESAEYPTETVYGYVPVELVEKLIEFHGGIRKNKSWKLLSVELYE